MYSFSRMPLQFLTIPHPFASAIQPPLPILLLFPVLLRGATLRCAPFGQGRTAGKSNTPSGRVRLSSFWPCPFRVCDAISCLSTRPIQDRIGSGGCPSLRVRSIRSYSSSFNLSRTCFAILFFSQTSPCSMWCRLNPLTTRKKPIIATRTAQPNAWSSDTNIHGTTL